MPEHYSTKGSVKVPVGIKSQLKTIADAYYTSTKKDVVVTSGKRTEKSQAEALYTRFNKGGDVKDYIAQKEAKAVKKAYDDAVKLKKKKPDIIDEMEKILKAQIKNRKYLSKHLSSKALDIRKKNMSKAEQKAFLKACKATAKKCLVEGTPEHFHLQFK